MPSNARSFVEPLLDWYGEHGRHELPWRAAERSAYELLVAEIMLQRTTATAVAGGYVAFVARYPTPATVVAAPSDDLEARIGPLGLSKRAEYIERCAGQLLARHAGRVPRKRSELTALHGVGEYTARSVSVHAFDGDVSAVDTNVRRLLARFYGLGPDPNADAIADLADELAPSDRSSDFLHAMLDFAADVCTPRIPDCDDCPIADRCDSSGRPTESTTVD